MFTTISTLPMLWCFPIGWYFLLHVVRIETNGSVLIQKDAQVRYYSDEFCYQTLSLGHVLNVPIMVSRFVAWMAIDQRRIEAMRDGLLPCCITHKDWTPSKCSQKEIGKVVMTFLADLLSSALYKVSCLTKVKLFINFLTQITPLTNTTNVGLNLQVFQIGLF